MHPGGDRANFPGNGSRLQQALIANKPSAVVLPLSISSYGGVTDVKKLLALGSQAKTPGTSKAKSEDYTIAHLNDMIPAFSGA
ncbi:MAG: hypothetical protein F6J93_04940 [Oscillatoria sp. SIO1A7]|nr:hypothetical protein [Oscillatoria sp. SIO1A7]